MSPSPARPTEPDAHSPFANSECGTICFTVHGPPRTKKTSNRLVTAGARQRILPSKAWETWSRNAPIQWHPPHTGRTTPETRYNVAALFYRDAERGDAVGYYQGLADLLERRGIVANDSQFASWDGSRLRKDAAHPRVEVTLTPVEAEAA